MTARVETRAEDGAMHIAVSGEIDLANAAAVEDQIREALSHSPETVSVDLTDLTYMDNAGIRVLFTLASRLKPLRIMQKLSWHSTRPPADSSSYPDSNHSLRSNPKANDQLPAHGWRVRAGHG
jgi:anti-anti-sigma factor